MCIRDSNLVEIDEDGFPVQFANWIKKNFGWVPENTREKNDLIQFWIRNQRINRTAFDNVPSYWYSNIDPNTGEFLKDRKNKKFSLKKAGEHDIRGNRSVPMTMPMAFAYWDAFQYTGFKLSRLYLKDIVDVHVQRDDEVTG